MKAVDTNVLIYGFDLTDDVKHRQAVDLLQDLPQADVPPPLLWQVACKYLNFLHRQQLLGRLTAIQIAAELQRVFDNYRLVLPTPDVMVHAVKLFNRHSLSHWDSLLLAACISAGIETLYSEDMSHGVTYDTVTVMNPFLAP